MDAFLAGAAAGLAVDVALYPIDAVKTRLQSAHGFWKAGGFRGIYRGMGIVSMGSVPGGSLFFGFYEYIKSILVKWNCPLQSSLSAVMGEMMACAIRVPVDMIKQHQQVTANLSLRQAVLSIYAGGQ